MSFEVPEFAASTVAGAITGATIPRRDSQAGNRTGLYCASRRQLSVCGIQGVIGQRIVILVDDKSESASGIHGIPTGPEPVGTGNRALRLQAFHRLQSSGRRLVITIQCYVKELVRGSITIIAGPLDAPLQLQRASQLLSNFHQHGLRTRILFRLRYLERKETLDGSIRGEERTGPCRECCRRKEPC